MFDHSEQETVIVTTIWWWRKLGRLAVNKQRSQRFDMERFNHKKINEAEGKEQFRVEISNRLAASEDMDAEV
jgi:hypothetical protein